jgi:hypothetical protein
MAKLVYTSLIIILFPATQTRAEIKDNYEPSGYDETRKFRAERYKP